MRRRGKFLVLFAAGVFVATGSGLVGGPTARAQSLKWKLELGTDNVHCVNPALGPDGTVYVLGRRGDRGDELWAVNPNGSVKWAILLPSGSTPASSGWGEPAGVAVADDGTVFAVCAQTHVLCAIDPNGTVKWRTREFNALSLPAVGEDGTVYLVAEEKRSGGELKLIAVDPTGKTKWGVTMPGGVGMYRSGWWEFDRSAPSIGPDGTIWVLSYTRQDQCRKFGCGGCPGPLEKEEYSACLVGVSPAGAIVRCECAFPYGRESGEKDRNSGIHVSCAADGTVLASLKWFTPGGSVWALDAVNPPVTTVDGKVIAQRPAKLYAVDPVLDPQKEVWYTWLKDEVVPLYLIRSGCATHSWPVTVGADGVMYTVVYVYVYVEKATYARLLAIGPDGSAKWSYDLGRFYDVGMASPIAIGSDGTLYFIADRVLYAISSTSFGLAPSSWPTWRHDNQRTGRARPTPTGKLMEKEPNDTPDRATTIPVPAQVQGAIGSYGDRDFFRFMGLSGQRLIIDIDAQAIGSGLDSYVRLREASGSVIASNDDAGTSRDSQLMVTLNYSGAYYIEVRASGDASTGTYVLTVINY